MASSLQPLLLVTVLLCSNSFITIAEPSIRPRALVLPVIKDAHTLQYVATIKQRTPLANVSVVVDLGGRFLWVDCDRFFKSSSYTPVRCGSAQCSLALSKFCISHICGLISYNPVIHTSVNGDLGQDVFSIESTDGKTPGRVVSVQRFLFTCGPTFMEGLASGAQGMLGLGRGPIGVPSVLASAFSFNRKFAICLPSTSSERGVIFFGNEPYTMLPNVEISDSLLYTPLFINPVSTAGSFFPGEKSVEYFIGVKSIVVGEKPISLNTTLLSIQSNGNGGTKISTVNPYTVLETSIYNALTVAFVREGNLTRVASVAPFEFCFDSRSATNTKVGPGVPGLELVLQSESVSWVIFGANSMVQVSDNVMCLGFVNGGSEPRTSIIIGSHQLQDNLLQFDIATSRLGFSSSLLVRQTTCSNFNFASTS